MDHGPALQASINEHKVKNKKPQIPFRICKCGKCRFKPVDYICLGMGDPVQLWSQG